MVPIILTKKRLKRSTGSSEGKDFCMRLSCFRMESLSNHLRTRSHAIRIHRLIRQRTVENCTGQLFNGSEEGHKHLAILDNDTADGRVWFCLAKAPTRKIQRLPHVLPVRVGNA